MSEQSMDLRSATSVLRRRRRTLTVTAVLGLLAGVGFSLLQPPMYSSATLVLLPASSSATGQPVDRDDGTQVQIAASAAVLGPAGQALDPSLTAREVEHRVEVTAPAADLIQFEARDESPERAEALAQAAAEAEVEFVQDTSSRIAAREKGPLAERRKHLEASLERVNVELAEIEARKETLPPDSAGAQTDAVTYSHLTAEQADLVIQLDRLEDRTDITSPADFATIIQGATPAKRVDAVVHGAMWGLAGTAFALLLTGMLLLLRARRDRRLRLRDELADAVGSPVVASVRSVVPRTVAGWESLLATYRPGSVDAWAMRQALRQLVFGDAVLGRAPRGEGPRPATIAMISLSDDPRALAVGAQLASYAASAGVRTRLVIAPGHESAAALSAACAQAADSEGLRPGLETSAHLRDVTDDVPLTVVVVVVDRRRPDLDGLPATSATALVVSSGSATAEELARVAVTADDASRRLTGILVADPDPLDRTSGHLLQHERAQQAPLPSRLTGLGADQGGTGNVTGLRRRQP